MSTPHEAFLEVANFIGARLCRDAIWADKCCNWFGVPGNELSRGVPVVAQRICGSDLYSGTTGIAAFLAHLHSATNERVFRMTAEGAIRQALSRLDDFPVKSRASFYNGLTGVAYVLLELSNTCNIERFTTLSLFILEEISNEELDHQNLDVCFGIAGAISPLLKIYQSQRRDFLLDTAVRYGEHLLKLRKETQNGWCWDVDDTGSQQPGFARGSEGIAWALLELYAVTQEEKFRNAAEQGFRYETSHLNWLKSGRQPLTVTPLQEPTEEPNNISVTWTEGVAGIGLSRLRAYQLLNDRTSLEQTQIALQTISEFSIASLFESARRDFSPARGLAGQGELLLEASRSLEDENYRRDCETIGEWGIHQYRRDNLPWPCGTPDGEEAPPFMIGLAGIGYFYLRLYDPTKIPSLLLVSA